MWKVVCPSCHKRIYLEWSWYKQFDTTEVPTKICPDCGFPILIRFEEAEGNRIPTTRIGRQVA